ncbi:MAG: ERCC4 domain-containing protein [Trueperaceae bacterium]
MTAPARTFQIARNPDPGSRLPVLLRIPLPDGPLLLATRDAWPATRDLYCHRLDAWPQGAQVTDEVPVGGCWRAGAAVHLVLQRRTRKRSLFVFTQKAGRPLIFWRSERTVRTARPGLRVPQARGLERALTIAIDTRERYPWRFASYPVTTARRRLPAGDYGVFEGPEDNDGLLAVVERKRAHELATGALSGAFQMGLSELAALPRAAVVIEGRLSEIVKLGSDRNVQPGWLLNLIAALQATYPNVPLLFAETPKLAADLAYRWLAACLHQARRGSEVAAGSGVSAAQHVSAFDTPDLDTPDLDASGLDTAAPASVADAAFAERGGPPARDVAADLRAHGPGSSAPLFASLRDAPLPPEDRRDDALQRARDGTAWTPRAYAATYGVTAATAGNDLRLLRERGELRSEGRGRAVRYLVADEPDDPERRS